MTVDAQDFGRIDVAVNLLWCVPGDVGGSEDYLVRQLLGLAPQRGVFSPTLYCTADFARVHPDLRIAYSVAQAPVDGVSRVRRVVAENTWLAHQSRHAHIVHHGGGTVPPIGHGPILLTLHDLQYLTFPDYVSATKLRYLRIAIPRSIRKADVIATPSEYVRATVIDHFGVDADRVVVVPHGVESELGTSAPAPDELRHTYGLGSGPVIVYPAITHPHKGHRFLLDVMARHWNDPELRLVLIGGRGAADDEVMRTIDELGLRQRVIRPGRVPHAARDGLIAMADALMFPSEYEGFGAPVVEAMALGTPVVCSDQPALTEVVGTAGLILPRCADAWAGALAEVSRQRDSLVSAGRQRAQEFTTDTSGAALAGAYRRVLER